MFFTYGSTPKKNSLAKRVSKLKTKAAKAAIIAALKAEETRLKKFLASKKAKG